MTSAEIGGIAGFIASSIPEILRYFQDVRDKQHELSIMRLQMQWEAQEHRERMEEIGVLKNAPEYIADASGLGVMSSYIRPVLTLLFFGLFAASRAYNGFAWTDDDAGLFAAVIAFWFGGRGFARVAGRVK